MSKRLTAVISGRVQGVGYRFFVRTRALDLGLSGSVENLTDSRVEVVAEGPRDELEHLLHWLKRGPPQAEVEEVQEQWSEAAGLEGFHVHG
jgi:acylphosphatase